jgi:eukaryotic-like serine/threonine-protein kinase
MAGYALSTPGMTRFAMRSRPPRLPGFVLGARLGGGPTSDVFAALDTTGRPGWAVKVLRDGAAADPTNVQLLRQEAKVGMAIRHANLVRVLRTGPDDDWPRFLVMERVPGQSLRAVLNQRAWLEATLALAIAKQTAAALATIHAAGYVHGDVKPDNLHLRPDRTCTLLDLGFAHRADDGEFFGAGFVLGTANYVAPELCGQPERDGPASDIFSLGVTIFELLTGELPYPGGNVEETMLQHRDKPPESLNRWRGAWPMELVDLVDRMLARDPEARPLAATIERKLGELAPQTQRRVSAA